MSRAQKGALLESVHAGLQQIGYVDDLLAAEYDFPDFLAAAHVSGTNLLRVELAAFAQRPFSYRSACFAVTTPANETPDAVRPYRALGAPQLLALHPDKNYMRRWKVGSEGLPQDLGTIVLSDIPAVFRDHEDEWKPQRVLRAKSIAFADEDRQLDFYDIGLMPALDASLRDKLDRDLQYILARCKEVFEEHHAERLAGTYDEALFRLIFRLIAAKMLIDRGDKPEWSSLNVSQVILRVEDLYFRNEPAENVLQDERVQRAAWELLRSRLNLRNLSVETLAYIYENTLVNEVARKKQGIHATPHEVAEYIVRRLPIHELAERERRVFEPFAGHAPFLISALGRIRELLPAGMLSHERHEYFVAMLSGLENDAFAREIARYSLILADYPNTDSWRLDLADAYTDPVFNTHLTRASVVLCNPPYSKFSVEEKASLPPETLFYKEAEALRKVLVHPPAVLGFVLPRTFLDRQDFRALRNTLAAHYSNIAVTVLPDKTFQQSDAEIALLLAHNLRPSSPRYYSAYVGKDDHDDFIRSHTVTWEQESSALLRRGSNDVNLWRTPLQPVWDALASLPILRDFASIHRGIEYTRPTEECVSDEERPGFVPGIQTTQDFFQCYVVTGNQYLRTEREVMKYLAYQLDWEQPKVLVNYFRRGRSYWHIVGALDEEGLVASHSFYGVWPRANFPVEVLSAVLNGPISNAFLFDNHTSRLNHKHLLEKVPVPSFTREQTTLLVSLVQDYRTCRQEWLAEPRRAVPLERRCYDLLLQIDAAVLEAYNLPANLENDLLRKFDGVPRSGLPFQFTGYGADFEQAKSAIAEKRLWRTLLHRYHELVDQKFRIGLTAEEAGELERLGIKMDVEEATSYDRFLQTIQAGRR